MKQLSQIVDQQMREWELRRQGTHPAKQEKGPVICISRDIGVGARVIARRLAEELGCTILGRDTIDYVAADLHAQRRLVDLLDEHGRASLERWVEGYLHGSPVEYDEYAKSLVKIFKAAAERGNVIFLGRGANFILGLDTAFCVRLVAPIQHRIEQIMKYDSCSHAEAEAKVHTTDKERTQFIHKALHRELNDPLAYHLTLNMGKMSQDAVVHVILETMKQQGLLPEKGTRHGQAQEHAYA